MQREIKFRAWDKKRKRMYEVLHLHQNDLEGHWATVKGYDCIEQKDIHIQIQPKHIELVQFTGLKDKDGKEVYEGDIVINETEELLTVIFADGMFLGVLVGQKIEESESLFNCMHGVATIEVIGNIHNNPELLEVAL